MISMRRVLRGSEQEPAFVFLLAWWRYFVSSKDIRLHWSCWAGETVQRLCESAMPLNAFRIQQNSISHGLMSLGGRGFPLCSNCA